MDEDLLVHLDALVRSGFHPRDEILETMLEAVVDEEPTVSEVALVAAIDASIATVRADSQGWPAVTDNDRLDEAFAALEAAGVIARQDEQAASAW